MLRLEVDRDAVGVCQRGDGIGQRVREPLLDCEPTGDQADEPGQLADPQDLLVGDVAEPGVADEREGVVLAERGELDRPFDDLGELAVTPAPALRAERGDELWIALVPVRRLDEGPDEPTRRVTRGVGVEVEPERLEDLAEMALEPLQVRRGEMPRSRRERESLEHGRIVFVNRSAWEGVDLM